MKLRRLSFVLLIEFMALFGWMTALNAIGANSAPVVSNVKAQQRPSTKIVDITYDVDDPDGDILTITVEISDDGGNTFKVPAKTFKGDVGSGIKSGKGKKVEWDAGKDALNVFGTNYRVKVIASDGVSGAVDTTVKEPPITDKNAIKAGYFTSQLVHALGESSASQCMQAVFLASQIANGGAALIATGTLTQSIPGSDNFTYAEAPADKLRIVLADGSTTEFIITALNGNFSGDADNFLKNDHEFRFRVSVPKKVDLEIYSLQNNRIIQATALGTFDYEGITYTANITDNGNYSFDVSSGFAEYESNRSSSGTISATRFSLSVNETYWYKSIYNSKERKLVENIILTTNVSWTAGTNNFQFVNGKFKRAFTNRRPADIDSYWEASGILLRSGSQYGQIGGGIVGPQIKIWLELPGERLDLEAWNL